ncbi:FHA domain-containing protein [Actinidia chinensis var. chinensis]|uniref:FHA domain-containing protein n=1 Tax=Actinidia chinensis var. chinensis TaxID=1590841 RepID=A0A2R6RUT8_ACTCC|nr:FHA domain-containing protein [Actinidia chinensis var. chinensis]
MAGQGSILKLIMEKGPKEGETLEFRPGSVIRIGRVVRGNTLAIKDAGVSSKHLTIEWKPGQWVVTDLDSSNGTVLNGSQLQSLTPSYLSDGDVIKLGEFTSIKVKIEVHGGESRLRRNPKRGTAKEEESGGEVVVAENRSRRGLSKANLASIGEGSALGLGIGGELGSTVGVEAENWGQRGGSKANLGLIGEDSALGLGIGGELGSSVRVVAEKPRGRGRPRKGKVVKSEPEESLCEVGSIEELGNVGPIEAKQGRQANTRRTRSSKDKEDSSGCGNGCQEIENPAQIVLKMTRGGMRRKKNFGGEPLECVVNEVLAKKEDVKESNLEREDCKMVEENLMNGEMEAFQAEEREDKDVEERGQTGHENLGASLGNKESGVEAGDGPDLEKMSLGEWFDYLEVYLPKQIHEETEEMILRMNQRAEQFHKFVSKQRHDKERANCQ